MSHSLVPDDKLHDYFWGLCKLIRKDGGSHAYFGISPRRTWEIGHVTISFPFDELEGEGEGAGEGAVISFVDEMNNGALMGAVKRVNQDWWDLHMPPQFPMQSITLSTTAGIMLGLLPPPARCEGMGVWEWVQRRLADRER